ncbi:MAG: sugar ABC transporter substrate-binding protein, partial [Caulobacter sp.]|nr:sugar ABC transporter substrate-binding protein [Vitreoscilla sp.]
MLKFASSLLAAAVLAGTATLAVSADQPVIGLITKTDTNP